MSEQAATPSYAGFGVRLASIAIDLVVLLPVILVGAGAEILAEMAADSKARFAGIVLSLMTGMAIMGYFVWFHARRGQTFGKRRMEIRVVSAAALGPITGGQALVRSSVDLVVWFVGFLLWVTMVQGLPLGEEPPQTPFWTFDSILEVSWTAVEIVVLLANAKFRAVHDFLAGTVVIRLTAPSR